MRRLVLPLALLLAGLALLPAGPSVAASPSPSPAPLTGPAATGEYQCALTGTGAETVAASLQLASVPDQVRPGRRLRLRGRLSLGFPSTEQVKSALLLATSFGISGADFSIVASSGKHAATVRAVSASGPQVPAGTPFTVSADVRLAPYTVPAGADEVDLSLPTADAVANPLDQLSTALGSVPDHVAFTATLAEGGLVASRDVACWVGSNDAAAPIARIPVEAAPPATHPSDSSAPGATTTGAPTAPQSVGGALPPVTDPGVVAPGAPPAAAPITVPGSTGPRAVGLRPTYAAIPPATRGRGVHIPDWALALLGLLLPVAAVGYAVAAHRQLKRRVGVRP